ncbi:sphingosine 1-phosphate receptor 1 [Engraulis encrasicolus]|uniref:sphingosine 1-phosphate receptor 1 n=1 Tax=Engraulis encrasicolus TaxID=184585 RepID=UPI002FD3E624
MADSGMSSDLIAQHYNYTGKLRKPTAEGGAESGLKADSVIFILICCLIILENLLVLLTIWRTKKFHKPMYYFIGNLALSDLLAGVVYTANILLSGANTYRLSPNQWFLREGSMFVALAASVFSLLAIALERHLTMLQMKLTNPGRAGRVFLLISAVWCVAGVLGGLPVMGWNCIGAMPSCSTVLPLYAKSYILFCTTVFSLILMAIVVLYARIYALVRTRSRQLVFRKVSNGRGGAGGGGGGGGGSSSGGGKSSEKSLALLKTVIIVLSCFIACWAPLFVLLLLDVACETGVGACPILYKAEWFLALAVLNSAMNPLIYTLTSNEMRRAFLRTLLCSQPWPCTGWPWPLGGSTKGPRAIIGAELSRSKSDTHSHTHREEGEYRGTIVTSSS